MATPDLVGETLRQGRRGMVGWSIGLATLTAVYTSSFGSVSGAKSAAIENYPEALKKALNLQDLTSSAGYLTSTVFGLPALLLISVFVVSAATRAIAGDEESGLLDLTLAYPVGRRQLVSARMCGIVAQLLALGAVVAVVTVALSSPAGLSIAAGKVVAVAATWVLLGAALAGVALVASAATGRRGSSLGTGAALTLLAYLADSFLPLISWLSWTKYLSPFYWFSAGDPIRNGLQPGPCAVLIGIAVVATYAAATIFERRDLRA